MRFPCFHQCLCSFAHCYPVKSTIFFYYLHFLSTSHTLYVHVFVFNFIHLPFLWIHCAIISIYFPIGKVYITCWSQHFSIQIGVLFGATVFGWWLALGSTVLHWTILFFFHHLLFIFHHHWIWDGHSELQTTGLYCYNTFTKHIGTTKNV